MEHGNRTPDDGKGPLLSQRAAVVFLLAALVGIGAAVLSSLAGNTWPLAVSVGGGASAMAVVFFHQIID